MVWFREDSTTVLVKWEGFCSRSTTSDLTPDGVAISSSTLNCFILYRPRTEPSLFWKGIIDPEVFVCNIDTFSDAPNRVSLDVYRGGSGFINMNEIPTGYSRGFEVFSSYFGKCKRENLQLFHYDCVSEIEPGIYLFEVHESYIDEDILWNSTPIEKVINNGWLTIPPFSFSGIDREDWSSLYPERKIIDDENYWKQQDLYVSIPGQ